MVDGDLGIILRMGTTRFVSGNRARKNSSSKSGCTIHSIHVENMYRMSFEIIEKKMIQ